MKKLILLLVPLLVIIVIFTTATRKAEKMKPLGSKAVEGKQLSVPALCQHPMLPTGCESAAAVMVLQYFGESVDMEEFAADWLDKNESFYKLEGLLYGPDPDETFIGDPFSDKGYGCYASPIVAAVNANSTVCSAEKRSGKTLSELCKDYIDHGLPVLIWVTTAMRPAKAGSSWYLENGEVFTWISGEHCVVLTGYDADHYYLNDPQSGSIVGYDKSVVDDRYQELGAQAVVFTKY